MDPGSTSVHVTVCESSTSLQINKFGDPVDNVTRFWKLSPNGVSSPKADVITPAVVVVILAVPVTVSVPIEKVETKFVPEALYRISEIYISIGMKEESKRNAAVLGHNYPQSTWYKLIYDDLTEQNNETIFSKSIGKIFN